jgi:hypothetical protein
VHDVVICNHLFSLGIEVLEILSMPLETYNQAGGN